MRVATALLSILLASEGCSATMLDDTTLDEDGGVETVSSHGSVEVGRTVALSPGTVLLRSYAAARFVRVTGPVDYQAVVGVASPLVPGVMVGCARRNGASEAAPRRLGAGRIELLDVGDIVLGAGAARLPLAARAFPDVGEIVSGVVYTSRDNRMLLPAATDYSIETSGSSFVEGFEFHVDAPAALAGVRLQQGDAVVDEQLAESGELMLTGGASLAVRWAPGEPAAGDQVYLDIEPLADDTDTVRCVFDDDGSGQVPARFLGASPGGAVELALHRHRLVRATLPEFGEMVVDFDFSVVAHASFGE